MPSELSLKRLKPKLDRKVVVTEHAAKRMIERMGVRKDKIQKLAEKAWMSKEECASMYRKEYSAKFRYGHKNHVHRFLMGVTFIFVDHEGKSAVLITVKRQSQMGLMGIVPG